MKVRDGRHCATATRHLRLRAWGVACLLAAPSIHAQSAAGGGLTLEPARAARTPSLRVVAGCGRMRLVEGPALLGPDPLKEISLKEISFREAAARITSPVLPVDLSSQIGQVAAAYGHDAALMQAMVRVESGFDTNAVSSKGAIGLMQIMPATAIGLGVADPAISLRDPAVNLRAGARHLRMLRDRYPGRLELAIAAYNAGEAAVSRWSGIPPYAETRAYVSSVLGWYRAYQEMPASRAALKEAVVASRPCID